METKHIALYLYTLLLLASFSTFAQRVCENTKQLTTLSDNINVYLYKEVSGNRIYFVPTELQLSKIKGKPEFSYQEYSNSANTSPDGAILHFLVTWGLSKKQFGELGVQVKKLYGASALLAGALHLQADASDFRINNTSNIGKILNASLKSKGSPPTTASGKMALSFKIKKEHVNIISEALTKPAKFSGTSISIDYQYKTYTCNGGINVAENHAIKLSGKMKKWFS